MRGENNYIIRQPNFAGAFYPGEEQTLNQLVASYLNSAELIKLKGKAKILILPHAGYQFSGQVAAYGFKAIEKQTFKRVILIGPSHQANFSGFALPFSDFWQTPLGKIEIDKKLQKELLNKSNLFFVSKDIHQQEHCLEVEVPFIQKINPKAKILPIIIGPQEPKIEFLAEALSSYLDEQTILLISSDLSHYPDYQTAKQKDLELIQSILEKDVERFSQLAKELDPEKNLLTRACGESAIQTGILISKMLNLSPILLKYANSGDVMPFNKEQVVGYASIIFSQEISQELNEQDKKELLKIARNSIKSYLKNGSLPEINITNQKIAEPKGVFVTLKKQGNLRGCIGTFDYQTPLAINVAKMAIETAFFDSRFPPLTENELDEIQIEISVLSPLRKIKDPFSEIQLGKHGVVIKKGNLSGVFLPQVATENNWDLETFLNQLCQNKIGIEPDAWKRGDVEIYTFTADVFEE